MKNLNEYIVENSEYFKTYEEICKQYKGTKYENNSEYIELDFVSQFNVYCTFTFESYKRDLFEAVITSPNLELLMTQLNKKFSYAKLELYKSESKSKKFFGKLFNQKTTHMCFIKVSYNKSDGNMLNDEHFLSLLNFFNCFVARKEENDFGVRFYIEQRYCSKLTDEIYKDNKYVYHITSRQSAEKIKKYGLIAKESRKQGVYHPKRIYVLKETDKNEIKTFAEKLYPYKNFVVFRIDLTLLEKKYNGRHIEFYLDPMYSSNCNGLYTLGPILPSCIEEINVDKL